MFTPHELILWLVLGLLAGYWLPRLWADWRRPTNRFTHRRSGKSIDLPKKPTRADFDRLVEFMKEQNEKFPEDNSPRES